MVDVSNPDFSVGNPVVTFHERHVKKVVDEIIHNLQYQRVHESTSSVQEKTRLGGIKCATESVTTVVSGIGDHTAVWKVLRPFWSPYGKRERRAKGFDKRIARQGIQEHHPQVRGCASSDDMIT